MWFVVEPYEEFGDWACAMKLKCIAVCMDRDEAMRILNASDLSRRLAVYEANKVFTRNETIKETLIERE